jgi:transcriptional regulator with XRE-family HTH domain
MFAKSHAGLSNIRLLRLLKNLSQDQLGLAIGLSGSYVSRIERGLVAVPDHARATIESTLGETALTDALPTVSYDSESRDQRGGSEKA